MDQTQPVPPQDMAEALTSPSWGQDGSASGRTKQKRVKSTVQVVTSEGERKRNSSADTTEAKEGGEEVPQAPEQVLPCNHQKIP